MTHQSSRRRFLSTTLASGAAWGLGGGSLFRGLPQVSAAETRLDPKLVRLDSGIEPLVVLLEQTPREKLLETVADKVRGGTSYQQVLAALLLASVRNVEPRPAVGFKFHAVLVVNACHLASLASPSQDRWLPIFWALDYFKDKQLEEEQKTGWKMGPVDEQAVPSASKARAAFVEAMNKWDEPAADVAVAGLVRSAGSNELFELFTRFGARDFRSIGHKAIYVANAWRTLQCIGWQHAEPVLRSLAYALQNRRGDPNPATSDLEADRPWRQNTELADSIRSDWQEGKPDDAAVREMVAVLHSGSNDDAVAQAIKLLNRGASPESIWDAVMVGAGELLMRQPGIIGLHGLTTTNALNYAYRTTGDDNTRRMMLLQNCAFLPMFRGAAEGRGKVQDLSVEKLEPVAAENPEQAADEIFADVSRNKPRAAAKVLAYLEGGGSADALIAAARRLVYLKGNDAHDYKFSSAVLEDYRHVSPAWRNKFLALSVFNLRGSGERDSGIVARTRAALDG